MHEIIIGIQGNQPFKITADGVSRKHARLTIFDDGRWLLEDLGSTNGTFVYDAARHCYERIVKKVITPTTKIRLGNDDTMHSYKFVAGRLVKKDIDDFRLEFLNLKRKWREVQHRKDQLKQWTYYARYVTMVSSLLAFARFIGGWDVEARMNLMFAGIMFSSLVAPIIGILITKRQERLNAEIKEDFACPNPDCVRTSPLSEEEIKRGQCAVCKKHI